MTETKMFPIYDSYRNKLYEIHLVVSSHSVYCFTRQRCLSEEEITDLPDLIDLIISLSEKG